MEQINKIKKPWYKKPWIIALAVIIAIVLIANSGNKQAAAAETQPQIVKESQWTEILTFKGNGMKKSPAFHLDGGTARLRYKYKSTGGIGMGLFSVYVVDEGDDIMVSGGIPEVMSQAENEESQSDIQKGSGSYYLNVNAMGSWTVIVEEKK